MDSKIFLSSANVTLNIAFIFAEAISIAFKMSFISMLSMEIAMNATDLIFAGGVLTITIIPFMLLVGFITPLPYNYYRLKKYNESCH